jgi:hypothetical protein
VVLVIKVASRSQSCDGVTSRRLPMVVASARATPAMSRIDPDLTVSDTTPLVETSGPLSNVTLFLGRLAESC